MIEFSTKMLIRPVSTSSVNINISSENLIDADYALEQRARYKSEKSLSQTTRISKRRIVRTCARMFLFYRITRRLAINRLSVLPCSAIKPWRIAFALIRFIFCTCLFLLLVTYNLPWSWQHFAIISTTYFPTSTSYTPHTMVMLFNAPKDFWPPWPLVCRSRNATTTRDALARIRFAFTPIFICRWTVFIATCPTVANPIEFAMRDVHFNSNSVRIPYRTTSYDLRNRVVACFSPLFYNERWQLILPTLELYRQMGISLQVYYVQSMLLEILQFLQAYERHNVTRIRTWTRVNLGDTDEMDLGYDPNTELEWRNQAAAHTDCLLKYKEVAEFVIVSDIDDVLIPRLGTSFLEEFRHLTSLFPAAAGFSYNRYNTQLITSRDASEFSLAGLLESAKIADEWEDPKYVIRPNRVQSVWLHWPGIIDTGSMVTVNEDANLMLHFRNWTMTDSHIVESPKAKRKPFPAFRFSASRFISSALADRIEAEFRAFLTADMHVAELFLRLPHDVHYYPLVAECYNRIFYGRGRHPINCPGPIRCSMPAIAGVRCAMAQRVTHHNTLNAYVRVHFAGAPGEFIVSNMGCRI